MQPSLFKKIVAILGSVVVLSALTIPTLNADESGGASGGSDTGGGGSGGDSITLLKIIAENTTNILAKVNNVPEYITQMLSYILNMQAPDTDNPATADMQTNFASTGAAIAANANSQMALIPQLNTDQLGTDANATTLPNANDLLYSTLLNQLYFNPDPRNTPGQPPSVNPPYNYLRNASGIAISHTMPKFNWRGKPADITRYVNYYNTAMSVQSFNGFVLANLLAEAQAGNNLTTAQMNLVAAASDSEKWFKTIAGEEIGKVLRQILMFESQSYVLQTQMLQTMKQQLAAQAMANSLLVAVNQTNEKTLLNDAQGT